MPFKKISELTADEICDAILKEIANSNLQQTASQITSGLRGILIPIESDSMVFEELRQSVAHHLEILKQEGKVIDNGNAEWDTVPVVQKKPEEKKRIGRPPGSKTKYVGVTQKPNQPAPVITIPVTNTMLQLGELTTVCEGLAGEGVNILVHSAPTLIKGVLKIERKLSDGTWNNELSFSSLDFAIGNEAMDPTGRPAVYYKQGTLFRITVKRMYAQKLFKLPAPRVTLPSNEEECVYIMCQIGEGQILTITELLLDNSI